MNRPYGNEALMRAASMYFLPRIRREVRRLFLSDLFLEEYQGLQQESVQELISRVGVAVFELLG